MKERADIEEIVNKYAEYKEAEKNFEDCKAMMSDDDADIRELAKEEYDSFKTALDNVIEELKVLLIPKDPNDDKNVVIESAAARAATKPRFSARNLCVCICTTPTRNAGKSRKYRQI